MDNYLVNLFIEQLMLLGVKIWGISIFLIPFLLFSYLVLLKRMVNNLIIQAENLSCKQNFKLVIPSLDFPATGRKEINFDF